MIDDVPREERAREVDFLGGTSDCLKEKERKTHVIWLNLHSIAKFGVERQNADVLNVSDPSRGSIDDKINNNVLENVLEPDTGMCSGKMKFYGAEL